MIELIIDIKKSFDSRPLLPKDIKEKWLTALRSGEYIKDKGQLNYRGNYCCLGVLCEIQKRPQAIKTSNYRSYDDETTTISYKNPLYEILFDNGNFQGFYIEIKNGKCFNSLTRINDNTETFDEVIDIIEKYF
jgi:hypothetical protein